MVRKKRLSKMSSDSDEGEKQAADDDDEEEDDEEREAFSPVESEHESHSGEGV